MIITLTLALLFIVITVLFLKMFIKLFYIIEIFKHFSVSICINFLRIIFRNFYYLIFGCLFCLVFTLLFCNFVNVLHVFYLFTNFNDYNSSAGSTSFHIHANIDKDANCLQINNNTSLKNLWLLFSASFLFFENLA